MKNLSHAMSLYKNKSQYSDFYFTLKKLNDRIRDYKGGFNEGCSPLKSKSKLKAKRKATILR